MPAVRPPAVAGTFYPSEPAALQAAVARHLSQARDGAADAGAPPKILVVPHAGYVYSGATAARGYALLAPVAARIRHAGAIFLGAWTPEAMGDYVGGPNHVLPTSRTARFSSGLSVLDFMKRTTITRLGPEAMRAIGPAAARLADSEGLGAHAASVRARLAVLNG